MESSANGSHRRGRFVDVFRCLHPRRGQAYTNWCTLTGARATNYGCRLDYIFADVDLVTSLVSCDILTGVEGSDHCPVRAELHLGVTPARRCPRLCTKYWPQFAGRQQTLSTYFGGGGKEVDKWCKKWEHSEEIRHGQQPSSSQDELSRQCGLGQSRGVSEHGEFWRSGSLCQQSVGVSGCVGHSSEDTATNERTAVTLEPLTDRVSCPSTVDNSLRETCLRATQLGDGPVLTKKPRLSDNTACGGGRRQSNLLTFYSKRSAPLDTGLSSESQVKRRENDQRLAQELTGDVSGGYVASQWKDDRKFTDHAGVADRASGWKNVPQLSQELTGDVNVADIVSEVSQKLTGNVNGVYIGSKWKDDVISALQELTSDVSAADIGSKLSQELVGNVNHADIASNLSQEPVGSVSRADVACRWKTLLGGPPDAPLCSGHRLPCVLRTVRKQGPNTGRQFWVCCKPDGPKNNPDARCDHFVWVSVKKS